MFDPPIFPFLGGLNGDDFFPDEEQEEDIAEDLGLEDELGT